MPRKSKKNKSQRTEKGKLKQSVAPDVERKFDIYKQFLVMTESIKARAETVPEDSKHFAELGRMAVDADKIYHKFKIISNTPTSKFETALQLYEDIYCLSIQFSKLYKRREERIPKVNEIILRRKEKLNHDFQIRIDTLNDFSQKLRPFLKSSIPPNLIIDLHNILSTFSTISKDLEEMKEKIPTMTDEKGVHDLNDIFTKKCKRASQTTLQSMNFIKKNMSTLISDKKPDSNYYLSSVDFNIYMLDAIFKDIIELVNSALSYQESWLITQGRIKQISDKELLNNNVPGSKELEQLNSSLKEVLKDLLNILAIETTEKFEPSKFLNNIIDECKAYIHKHSDNNIKLQSFLNVIQSISAPVLQDIQQKYQNTTEALMRNSTKALYWQKEIKHSFNTSKKKPFFFEEDNLLETFSDSKNFSSAQDSQEIPNETKKDLVGLQGQPLKSADECTFIIEGKTTSTLSDSSSSSLFAGSFVSCKTSHIRTELKLSDFITPKLVEDKITKVLETSIRVDQQKNEKWTIQDLQAMQIKQNALLMLFCEFSETVKNDEFQSSFPTHYTNRLLLNNFRNCIYYYFPHIFSCTWPIQPDELIDASRSMGSYRSVVSTAFALLKSIKNNDFKSLIQNPFFAAYSAENLNLTTTKEMMEKAENYFKTMAQQSLSLENETTELAQRFAVATGNLYARENGNHRDRVHAEASLRHSRMIF